MKTLWIHLSRFFADRPGEPPRYRTAKAFYLLTLLSDLVMIVAGLGCAVVIRETLHARGLTVSPEPGFVYTNFAWVLGYFWAALVVAFHYVDVYRDRRFLTGNRELWRVVKCVLAFLLVNELAKSLAHSPLFLPSRLTLALSFVFITAFVLTGREVVSAFRRQLRRRGLDTHVALVIGAGPVAQRLGAELDKTPLHGYRLAGYLSEDGEKRPLGRRRVLGGLDRLERVMRRFGVDEVFVCEPEWHAPRIMAVFTRLRPLGVNLRVVSEVFNVIVERVGVPVDAIDTTPILDFAGGATSPWRARIKRTADMVVSFLFLLLFSWLYALIAAAIWLETGRPLLYKAKRVGKGGRLFSCYKFRSMVVDAEAKQETLEASNEMAGPVFKMKDDPRVTRVGRILRRYSLDELPQFWNVLRGDMSLVGPRPPLPAEVDRYEDWHRKRLAGPMGLSGLWQVSGRNEVDFEDMALIDIYYLRNHSLFLDYRIAIRTLFAVLLGQGR